MQQQLAYHRHSRDLQTFARYLDTAQVLGETTSKFVDGVLRQQTLISPPPPPPPPPLLQPAIGPLLSLLSLRQLHWFNPLAFGIFGWKVLLVLRYDSASWGLSKLTVLHAHARTVCPREMGVPTSAYMMCNSARSRRDGKVPCLW